MLSLLLQSIAPSPTNVRPSGWCPFANRRPLNFKNFWTGRKGQTVQAVVIHIAAGPFGAIFPTFNHEGGSSSHFAVAKDGRIDQFVSVEDAAWCNGLAWANGEWRNPRGVKVSPSWVGITPAINPNLQTVSIEHEGQSGDVWTPAMLDADVRLLKWLSLVFHLEWHVDSTLIGHNAIDPVDRARDPGPGLDLQALVDLIYAAPPASGALLSAGFSYTADEPPDRIARKLALSQKLGRPLSEAESTACQ